MVQNQFTKPFLLLCRQKLLEKKAELLNRIQAHRMDFEDRSLHRGDEADQTVALLEENQLLISNQRVRHQLIEVESALARLEKGHFGICEETQEPIEKERLLAIPWTRLSIEGAELRESRDKKQTKKTMTRV